MRRLHFASLWLAGLWVVTSSAAPAVLDSTPAGRADVERAVSAALGAEVLISDDALTASSVLIIERRLPRTMEGRVLAGRILDCPETFQLVLEGDQCVLVHRRTGEPYPLENARCHASPAKSRKVPESDQDR